MKTYEVQSTSDDEEIAHQRRWLLVWTIVGLGSGLAVSAWVLAFDAPAWMGWLVGFAFGANVALTILTWRTAPRSTR